MRRPEGRQCSSDYKRLDMTAADLIERKGVPKGRSASVGETAIPVVNPLSENN